MPINKNALVRYQALDRCLSDRTKRYYIDDLVEACCKALAHVNDVCGAKGAEGVGKRQVQKDLNQMELIYEVSIAKHKDGHKVYFSYEQGSKTLRDTSMIPEEMNFVSDALLVVKRFQGIPHLDWLNDLENKLYTTSRLGNEADRVVSFQYNPFLHGMNEWFKPLFHAILKKTAVEITYHPFGKEAKKLKISPYHLKQYNNRWFMIGKRNDFDSLSNFAIDRIENVEEIDFAYEALDEDFDFEEYFSDVVGVSVSDTPVMDVVLRVKEGTINYILTKPLHGSQPGKATKLDDGRWEITLKVKKNYELLSLLRSFGSGIEVVSPAELRQDMKNVIDELAEMYKE